MAQRAVRPSSQPGPQSRRTPEQDAQTPAPVPEPSRAPARPPLDAYFGRTSPKDPAPGQDAAPGDTFIQALNRRFGR
ncbi:MAG: hypothetical protein NTZ05_11110 [Chloroflexi bacterium]|nr:hypothetical protein [Chloroflexota bacterium]